MSGKMTPTLTSGRAGPSGPRSPGRNGSWNVMRSAQPCSVRDSAEERPSAAHHGWNAGSCPECDEEPPGQLTGLPLWIPGRAVGSTDDIAARVRYGDTDPGTVQEDRCRRRNSASNCQQPVNLAVRPHNGTAFNDEVNHSQPRNDIGAFDDARGRSRAGAGEAACPGLGTGAYAVKRN